MSMVNMAKYSVKLDNNYYFNTILAKYVKLGLVSMCHKTTNLIKLDPLI
jgi:hypothetical protein